MIFSKLKVFVFVALLLQFSNKNFGQSYGLVNQVIGSSGYHFSGNNVEVSSTVGEAVIETGINANNIITQGFLQPISTVPFTFEYQVNSISCNALSNGKITISNIQGCPPPYQITWSNGQTGLQATNLSPGFYQATVASENCVTSKDIEVKSADEADCKLIFYSGFTPNGDNKNNLWIIDNIELEAFKNNSIDIFNRWGGLVWQGKNYNNTTVVWKGENSGGSLLAASTYFYTMAIGDKIYKGFIELTN